MLLTTVCIPSVANAHEEINREPKNRIDNYQTITISQPGSLFYGNRFQAYPCYETSSLVFVINQCMILLKNK